MDNNNGYVGVNGDFKTISKRFIGVNNTWNEQDFKFVGDNGYWRLIYTKNPIDLSSEFYVRYLEGYSIEKESSLSLFGFNLKDYQLVSPQNGGYFELEKNGSDLFQNFANGSFSGTPLLGDYLAEKKCMQITTINDYFTFPSDITATGLFGSDGAKNYNLSNHFYINALPTGDTVTPILSYGDSVNGMEIVVSSSGRLQQKLWSNYVSDVIETNTNTITTGWTSYLFTRLSGETKLYLKGSTVPVVTTSKSMIAPNSGTPIKIGSSFKYSATTTLTQSLSPSRTLLTKYSLSNNNKTMTSLAGGDGTSRTNNVIKPNTGKYYFETKIDTIAAGVSYIGLGDSTLSPSIAIATAGWSISSNSRVFNKAGGVVWGSDGFTWSNNDIIGCVYDSNVGSATWYKNNSLLGTSTTAITGNVEFMLAGSSGHVSTIRIKSTDWTYSPPISGSVQMPEIVNYSGLTYYSTIGSGFKYVYESSIALSTQNIQKLLERNNPDVILKNKVTNVELKIPDEWVSSVKNEYISITIPPTTPLGSYDIFIRYFGTVESYKFPLNVIESDIQLTTFIDDFSNENTLTNNYYCLNKSWGGANGGVIPDNVFIRGGELILKANGDRYTGTTQGVDRSGVKKYHTDPLDPKFGEPWKNRVGGCVIFNKRTGFGSYEIDAYIPNQLGAAYAMWTFFYNEIYPSDPRWNDFLTEGLRQQGNSSDGYYITRNHEIDIEFPSHLEGGNRYEPSLSNMKCNTWRGENQNWDVEYSASTYWEEYRDNLTPLGFNIADGNYHKLRYDWYPDKVEFFIDGVLKQTNVNTSKGETIPDISGYFNFGIWFPSSALTAKPWLVNPLKGWAGGVVDADGGQKADFESIEMRIKTFKFIPFSAYTSTQRNIGETSPFGGFVKKI